MPISVCTSTRYHYLGRVDLGNVGEVWLTRDHMLVYWWAPDAPWRWSWEVWEVDQDSPRWDQPIRININNWSQGMKRKDKSEIKPADHASRKGLDKLPSFSEFMCSGTFEDGTPRQAPTITVWAGAGEWKASVRDREENLVMWLSADTWDALIKLLDSFVLDPTGPWRHEDPSHPRDGKRVRK